MVFTPHGRHLIAGAWVSGETTFASDPASGPVHRFSVGTPALVEEACAAAEEAFWSYGYSTRESRAAFLEAIADEIEARAEAITEIGTQETGLPEARLQGERSRTTGQLRLFAAHIRKGDYLDRRHDPALPDRQPLPRPCQRSLGRVQRHQPVAALRDEEVAVAQEGEGAVQHPVGGDREALVQRGFRHQSPPSHDPA